MANNPPYPYDSAPQSSEQWATATPEDIARDIETIARATAQAREDVQREFDRIANAEYPDLRWNDPTPREVREAERRIRNEMGPGNYHGTRNYHSHGLVMAIDGVPVVLTPELRLSIEVWHTWRRVEMGLPSDEIELISLHPQHWPECLDMLRVIEDGLLSQGAAAVRFVLSLNSPWSAWGVKRDFPPPKPAEQPKRRSKRNADTTRSQMVAKDHQKRGGAGRVQPGPAAGSRKGQVRGVRHGAR